MEELRFPIFWGDTETNLNDYASAIEHEHKKFKNNTGKNLRIIFEPGKFLVSDSDILLLKLITLKDLKIIILSRLILDLIIS